MRPTPPASRVLLAVFLLLGLGGAAWLGAGAFPGRAEAEPQRVASSICEAHALRALKAERPDLEIEIPPDFDMPWPTRQACLSYAAAQDPATPGPLQPIPFSHKHHSGTYGMDCQYCHSGTDRSQAAGVPAVEVCMGCHLQFAPSYDEFEGIRTLKQHWEREEPIEWVQVHRLPEHVQFRHDAHDRAGFGCEVCHGAVEEMDKLYLVPEIYWWPWLLPTQKLQMGWCINCHRQNNASQDCYTCHY